MKENASRIRSMHTPKTASLFSMKTCRPWSFVDLRAVRAFAGAVGVAVAVLIWIVLPVGFEDRQWRTGSQPGGRR